MNIKSKRLPVKLNSSKEIPQGKIISREGLRNFHLEGKKVPKREKYRKERKRKSDDGCLCFCGILEIIIELIPFCF